MAYVGRAGVPLTEEERQIRHEQLTGESTPPPRGTGRAISGRAKSASASTSTPDSTGAWILLIAQVGVLAGLVYYAHKSGMF